MSAGGPQPETVVWSNDGWRRVVISDEFAEAVVASGLHAQRDALDLHQALAAAITRITTHNHLCGMHSRINVGDLLLVLDRTSRP